MSAETVFRLSNGLALFFWAFLIFLPRARVTQRLIHSGAAPLVLCSVYLALVVFGPRPQDGGSFGSLEGVQILFQSPWILCAGWVHYLAFDLFVGSFIARDAQSHQIPHLWTVPLLIATFWLGPVGLLSYRVASRFFGQNAQQSS